MLIKLRVVFPRVSAAEFEPILREHITRPYQLHDEHPQETWQQLPEIPSGKEMNSNSPNGATHAETLPENILEGPWKSKETYIGSQYQLLRYDAINPLRDSICSYKNNPETTDFPTTSIYTNVRYFYFYLAFKHRLIMDRSLLWDILLQIWVLLLA